MEVIYIKPGTRLDQVLKYENVVSTGGEAKQIIQSGEVLVNGNIEKRRGYKLKEGDIVEIDDVSFKISLTG